MTNEEASIIIGNIPIPLVILGTNDKCYSLTEYQQAKARAIEVLEQQACDDCISRQEAIKLIQRYGVGCFDAEEFSPEQCERFVIQKLNELPHVTPKEKTGHWESYCYQNNSCSVCGYIIADSDTDEYKYCPNCGARMVSE